jgi:hypothetical protein
MPDQPTHDPADEHDPFVEALSAHVGSASHADIVRALHDH